jgi:hypothetical protein
LYKDCIFTKIHLKQEEGWHLNKDVITIYNSVGIVICGTRPRQVKPFGIKASCHHVRQVAVTCGKLRQVAVTCRRGTSVVRNLKFLTLLRVKENQNQLSSYQPAKTVWLRFWPIRIGIPGNTNKQLLLCTLRIRSYNFTK